MSHNLDQQPGRVPAGTAATIKGFFAGLDAGLEPRRVFHFITNTSVQIDKETERGAFRSGDAV